MYVETSCASGLTDVAPQHRLYTESEIQIIIRNRIAFAGGPRRVGRMLGVSPSYVSRVALGFKPIGPKILELFGYEKVSAYRIKQRDS